MAKTTYNDVRLWQTHFSVHHPLKQLPIPEMIVEESQQNPAYRWDGKNRFEDGSQIVITLSGQGAIKISGEEFILTKGKAFIHNHNDPKICYYYPREYRDPWRFLWFAFYGGNSAELVSEINEKNGYIFNVAPDSQLLRELKEYKNYAGIIQILSPFEGSALVHNIIGKLCQPSEEQLYHAYNSMTAEILNIIASDPAAELHAEKIAASFQVSREHLSRIFRQETGVSLHEYIIRFRLKLAMDMLRRTRLSLKEIATHCGWNDYSNFYRIFIKRFNCPPQKIRDGGWNREK